MENSILFLLDNGLDILGGSPKSTATISKILSENGFYAYIWCPCFEQNNTVFKNDKCIYTYNKTTSSLISLVSRVFSLLKTIKKIKPSIIHAQDPQCAVIAGFLKKYGLISKKIKVYYTDRKFLTSYKDKSKRILTSISRYFDLVVCTTSINADNWKKMSYCKNVVVINNILDEIWYDREVRIQNRNPSYTLGFCGRFEQYKRWDIVYKICNMLLKDDFTFSFVFSYGVEEKQEFHKYLDSLIALLGDRMVYKYNIKNIDEIIDFYDSLDFFVLTSDNESFGRTLLESMSRKVITFGNNSGGVPDVIDSGFLYDNNDLNSLIVKIKNASVSDEKLMLEKQNTFNYFIRKYSLEEFKSKILVLYKEVYHE